MSVWQILTLVMAVLHVATQMVAMSVHATLDILEMGSHVQVSKYNLLLKKVNATEFYVYNSVTLLFLNKCVHLLISADIDECEMEGICDDNAECFDTPGSYNCICKTGYSTSGDMCDDIDECLNSPCDQNATCSNNNGSFSCHCESGFRGDGFNCTRE